MRESQNAGANIFGQASYPMDRRTAWIGRREILQTSEHFPQGNGESERMTEYLGPYELGKVHCVDCLEALPQLPDGCVDAVITDPIWPDTDVFNGVNARGLFRAASNHFARISTRAAIHLGCDSDPSMADVPSMKFFRVCWLRYARPHYKGRLLYGADVAYLYGDPPKSRLGNHVISGEACKTQSTGRTTIHKCERSIEHVEFLVRIWSENIVLDPFAGSGTTGVAAVQLGRKFLGFEIDPDYCELANKRIEAARKGITVKELEYGQGVLFE